MTDIKELNDRIQRESAFIDLINLEMDKVIVGQKYMVDRLLIGLLSNGHILLEGVPGLAKTLAIKSLASCIHAAFSRIQFTPDLLPADLIGTLIYNQKKEEFTVRKGPIFSNFVLADKINRAPAKVQSALLEAMQERQVTIGDETYPLPNPFLVLATQNPLEQEGTYPLPEAQIDRFMMKVLVGYPNRAEERAILDAMATSEALPSVRPVVSAQQILNARHVVNTLYVDDKIRNYIVDLVLATRPPIAKSLDIEGYIQTGASPRATINLTLAARAIAFLSGRHYVAPQDVKTIAMDVLRHRVSVTYEAEAENVGSEDVVQKILDALPV